MHCGLQCTWVSLAEVRGVTGAGKYVEARIKFGMERGGVGRAPSCGVGGGEGKGRIGEGRGDKMKE